MRAVVPGRRARPLVSMRATVEPAGQKDLPGLLELMSQFYAESNYELNRSWADESFRRLLRNEALGAVWIAREGTQALGYVVLTLRHSMEFGRLVDVIDDLFVGGNFRNKGVGSALLTVLLERSRSLELGAVHVEVGSTNHAAKALYEAFGLKPVGDGRQVLAIRLI